MFKSGISDTNQDLRFLLGNEMYVGRLDLGAMRLSIGLQIRVGRISANDPMTLSVQILPTQPHCTKRKGPTIRLGPALLQVLQCPWVGAQVASKYRARQMLRCIEPGQARF